ncbi:MAG: hypothetical protein JWQ78_547 [Sediminibacterium sp.]|nr:hypothetical protein [Sediminibacterium sp.]
MEFIKIAYCITVPLLILLTFLAGPKWKQYSTNVLAVTNLLLVGNSVFMIRQIIAVYQLARSLAIERTGLLKGNDWALIQVALLIALPFLSLSKPLRGNRLFSFCLLALVYAVFPFSSWNVYDLLFKIPPYLCLLCSGYALLWLFNQLPDQSPVD